MIHMGMTVRCKVTGFAGVAVSRQENHYSGVQIGVQSQELYEGKPLAVQWFDEMRLEPAEGAPLRTGFKPPVAAAIAGKAEPGRTGAIWLDPKDEAPPRDGVFAAMTLSGGEPHFVMLEWHQNNLGWMDDGLNLYDLPSRIRAKDGCRPILVWMPLPATPRELGSRGEHAGDIA